jgi:hypothetical protein
MNENEVNNGSSALGIVSLVLGILSIVLVCFAGWIALIPAIAGIICAAMQNKRGKSGISVAGLVCSIIGCVLGAIMLIATIYLAVVGAALVGSATDYLNDLNGMLGN